MTVTEEKEEPEGNENWIASAAERSFPEISTCIMKRERKEGGVVLIRAGNVGLLFSGGGESRSNR